MIRTPDVAELRDVKEFKHVPLDSGEIGSFYRYDVVRLTSSKVWLIYWSWTNNKDAAVQVRLGEDLIQAVNSDVNQGTKERAIENLRKGYDTT